MKTPRAYQVLAIERATRKHTLIADDCGLGKTLEAIEAAKIVQAQLQLPVLVIAPNETVKRQWLSELQSQGYIPSSILWLDSTSKGTAVEDHLEFNRANGVVLTHYEAMKKHLDTLKAFYWCMIIADEAHRIKNRNAQRTLAIKQLRAYRKVALTGTPYDRNPADIWSILNWLDPRFFTSYWRFFDNHVNYQEIIIRRTGQKVKTVLPNPLQDAERFARVLRPYMIQRKKEDVRADLPENIVQYIDLDMPSAQKRAYEKLIAAEDPIVEIDGVQITVQIVLTQILREIQLTTDPQLLGLNAPSIKLDWVQNWIEDNPNESVIIFTRFAETAKALHRALNAESEADRQFELIIGGTKRPVLDSSKRRIIGTIAAMGEGLDLPHIDHAIFIDVDWSSILMQQALDRIHRINIENVKHTYYLRCVDTTDMLVHQALQSKWSTKELAEQYLNGRGKE